MYGVTQRDNSFPIYYTIYTLINAFINTILIYYFELIDYSHTTRDMIDERMRREEERLAVCVCVVEKQKTDKKNK